MWRGPEGHSGNFPEIKQNDIQVKNESKGIKIMMSHYCDILLCTYHDKLAELEYLGKFVAHTARGERKLRDMHYPQFIFTSGRRETS